MHREPRKSSFWLLLTGILAIASVLRVWQLATRPGYDWDETVYHAIGANMAEDNLLQAKPEYGSPREPYLYHPPLYFMLLGLWFRTFGTGMTQGRALAVVGSLIMLVVLALWLRRLVGDRWALVATFVLAIDAWVVFTNRVGWIENTMMVIGIVGLVLYHRALVNSSAFGYLIAGGVLGLVTVYKHVGLYFLVAVVIHWLIIRRESRKHLVLIGTSLAVFLSYIGILSMTYGTTYWDQSTVQIQRILGMRESRGAVNSFSDIVNPLVAQYKIFAVTLLLVAIGGVLVLILGIKEIRNALRHRRATRQRRSPVPALMKDQPLGYTLLFAWAAAAALCFGVMRLWLPHYFAMIVIPMICFLAAILANGQHDSKKATRLTAIILTVIVAANALAFYGRFVVKQDNALKDVATWVDKNLPQNARIMTEESIGSALNVKEYCKLGHANRCAEKSSYVITYDSHTQSPPDTPAVNNALHNAKKLASFKGFKEDLTVWEIRN